MPALAERVRGPDGNDAIGEIRSDENYAAASQYLEAYRGADGVGKVRCKKPGCGKAYEPYQQQRIQAHIRACYPDVSEVHRAASGAWEVLSRHAEAERRGLPPEPSIDWADLESLRAWLKWNDDNGCWDDDERLAEGLDPLTLEHAAATIREMRLD